MLKSDSPPAPHLESVWSTAKGAKSDFRRCGLPLLSAAPDGIYPLSTAHAARTVAATSSATPASRTAPCASASQ